MSILLEPRGFSLGSPGSEQIVDALSRILASEDFIASDRNRRFLSYVVAETLAGRAERLKGYTIAVQVFGRDASFDAQTDPLVRIEARRLRQSLERYYLTAGVADPVRISLPKGGYIPLFESVAAPPATPPTPDLPETHEPRHGRVPGRFNSLFVTALAAIGATIMALVAVDQRSEPNAPTPTQSSAVPMQPSVLVQSFAPSEVDTVEDRFRDGLTDQVTHALARFKTMRVASKWPVEIGSSSPPGKSARPGKPSPDYVLKGSVRALDQTVRVTVQLEEYGSGMLLWTQVFERGAWRENALEIQAEVASNVAATLGDPYDVLFSNELSKAQAAGAAAPPHYACVLSFYPYWLNPTPVDHRSLRNCHENSARSAAFDARVWTNLAWLYLDEHRFDFNRISLPDPPLERAAEAARRAVSLQPDSARAHLAVAIVQWFRKDLRSFDRHAELALSLNPNDRSVNAELGLRYGLRGDWERSLPLIDRAIAHDPIRWQTYRVSYAHHALEIGDYRRALEELRLTKMSDHPALKVVRAAIYGHLGHFDEARTHWNAAVREMPQLGLDPRTWIDDRSPSPLLRQRILEGLEKAGLLAAE